MPAGANYSGPWNWISSNPSPYSGTQALNSGNAGGTHLDFFNGATATLPIGVGDKLIAYVYLDPVNKPTEIMLQWNSNSCGWCHRAFWSDSGSDSIGWGTLGTDSLRYIGVLPTQGNWARLEVPASLVGLEGQIVNGIAFTLGNGDATWDHAGKNTPGSGGSCSSGSGGTLILQNNTSGGDGTFDFTTNGGSTLPGTTSITTSGGSGTVTFSSVNDGTYSITQVVPGGWGLTSASCTDGFSAFNYPSITNIKIVTGATVTCTFNNIKTVNSGYAHYRKIDVDGSKVVGSNQSGFPVLVCFNGSAPCNQSVPELKNVGNGGVVTSNAGNDIIFTSDSGGQNILPFEKEKYVSSTGEAVYWVKLSLTQGSPTTFYMFYGNSGDSDHSNKTGVWDSNYKGVYHLSENPLLAAPQFYDSTSNAKNLTLKGTYGTLSSIVGQIGNAYSHITNGQYEGYLASSTMPSGMGTSDQSISGWVNIKQRFATDGNSSFLFGRQIANYPYSGFMLRMRDNGKIFGMWGSDSYISPDSASALALDTWYYLTLDLSGSSVKIYINGVLNSTTPKTYNIFDNTSFDIGNWIYAVSGRYDEVRMSNISRSVGWIQTEYNNYSSPSTFYTVGAQQ
jgi:hypothetical protein